MKSELIRLLFQQWAQQEFWFAEVQVAFEEMNQVFIADKNVVASASLIN